RKAQALCQHCGKVRRRLETFVLVNDEGAHKQVGRNCLADFCRSPEAAAALCGYAEIIESARGLCDLAEDEDGFGFGGRHVARVGAEELLAMTHRVIRHCGWTPRSQADEWKRATADVVADVFFNPGFWKSDNNRDLQEVAR